MTERVAKAAWDYATATDVALQWYDTHRQTGDPRCLRTALACAQIARERGTAVAAEREKLTASAA